MEEILIRLFTIGLFHEHQRPDRDSYITYHCANVDPACENGATMPSGTTCCDRPPAIPTDCCKSTSNFQKRPATDGDKIGSYDSTSIMHYLADAFASTGLQTLTALNPTSGMVVPTTKTGIPSSLDFFGMCSLYGSKCPGADRCMRMGCPWRLTECGGLLTGGVVNAVCADYGPINSPPTCESGPSGSIDVGCTEPNPSQCEIQGCW